MRFKNFFKKPPPDAKFAAGLHRDYLEDLLNSLYIGLFVVAVFLDLMIFEIMYMIFLLSFSKYVIDYKVPDNYRKPKKSIYRVGQREHAPDQPQNAETT